MILLSIEKKEFFRILILLFFHWSHNNIFILINFEQQEYKKAFLKKIIIAIELLRFLTLPSSPHSLIISLTNYRNCTSQWEMTEYRQKTTTNERQHINYIIEPISYYNIYVSFSLTYFLSKVFLFIFEVCQIICNKKRKTSLFFRYSVFLKLWEIFQITKYWRKCILFANHELRGLPLLIMI